MFGLLNAVGLGRDGVKMVEVSIRRADVWAFELEGIFKEWGRQQFQSAGRMFGLLNSSSVS